MGYGIKISWDLFQVRTFRPSNDARFVGFFMIAMISVLHAS